MSRHAIPAFRLSATAVAVSLACQGTMAEVTDPRGTVLATVNVEAKVFDTNPHAEQGAPYKAKVSGDQRRVKELAETPATIQVVTQQAMQEGGKQDLREVLASQPGVTIGTGENGNAFGDRYILRGQEARSDVFIDGLRDPGMTTREIFAVDQIEITKGPSSSFAGRGSSGGAINLITKQANAERDFTKIDLGFGTDNYQRTTLDANKVINDRAAVRLNLLDASRDVPGRAPADRDRRGLLLSGVLKVTDDVVMAADYYHLEGRDSPDLGTFFNQSTRRPERHVPVYLQSGSDHLNTTVDTATVKASWRLSPSLRLLNATRIGQTRNSYITTGANGRNASFDGGNTFVPSVTLSSHQGFQEVQYLVNRTDLFLDQILFGAKHQMLFGLELNDEQVLNGNYTLTNRGTPNCRTGTGTGANNAFCIRDASGSYIPGINTLLARQAVFRNTDSDYRVKTVSASAMDTIDFSDRVTGFFGVRHDRYQYSNLVGASDVPVNQVSYEKSSGFVSGHLGATYKLNDDGIVYAAVGSAVDLNGGESDVGASCGYGGICTTGTSTADRIAAFRKAQPEKSLNYEIGTKWQLMQQRLLATAALFRTLKSDVMEAAGTLANQSDQSLNGQSSYTVFGTLNTGKNQVQGVEFTLAGNLTDKLSVLGGVTLMKSEVLESINPVFVGKRLNNFAERSGTLLMKYQATPALAIGSAVTYKSEMQAGQPDTADGYDAANQRYGVIVPAYTVMDAFAEYRFNDKLSARLNVNNVTDKEYVVAAYRSGSFMYLGDRRNSYLTLSYRF